MYTLCPNCKTHFEITQKDLDIAHGQVRCGQCEHIFNANNHLYDESDNTPNSKAVDKLTQFQEQLASNRISELKEGKASPDSSLTDTSNDINNKMYQIALSQAKKDQQEQSRSPVVTADNNSTHKVPKPTEEIPVADVLDIIDFDSEENEEINTPPTITDFKDHNTDDGNMDILKSLIDIEEKNKASVQEENDIPGLNHRLNQSQNEFASLDDEFDSSDNLLTSLDDELDDGDDLLAELEEIESAYLKNKDADNSSEQTPSKNDTSKAVSSSNNSRPHKNNEDEAVVPSFLTQEPPAHSSPIALFSWLAATIILLLLLAAQYLHFNSLKFSQNSNIRPVLEFICPISHCSLPLIKDPGKIVTVTHDVRSHASLKNVLEIELTFKNKATHKQNYPILEITFSDASGNKVARRQFLPQEYLNNKTAYKQGLASNQSQKINLQIIDPEPKSLLSFQFNYL